MIVRTPAVKLAVEIRSAAMEDGRLVLKGVAGVMPCSVELTAGETLALARHVIRPTILGGLLKVLAKGRGS